MINLKTPQEIKIMAEGGAILTQIVRNLITHVKPGIATKELEKIAENLILKSGGRCSFKNYEGYPSCLCVSINEEVVHSLPSNRRINEGDLVSLDLGLFYKGYHTDMAVSLPVGQVKPEVRRLVRVTKKALKRAIKKIKPGAHLGDIGYAIQKYVESQGFSVIRELCGHGIGKKLHEDPQILNYGRKGEGIKLKTGMVLCIEPMVSMGNWQIEKTKDGYGYKTIDNSLTCHFEQTIAVTKNGAWILTKF